MTERALEIVRPTRGWAGFRLDELWRARELLLFFAWRNILVRYKQTFVGVGWAALQPVLLMVVLAIFFGSYAKQAGVPGLPFYLAGLVPWTFFANSVTQASASLVGNASLLSKVYFPRLTAPIAAVLASVVDFAIAFLILIVVLLAYGISPKPIAIAVVPALFGLALVTALGIGFWLSALNVSYRDVQYVVPFLIQLGLFASIFASNVHREPWHTVLGLNPMAGVVEGFRWALVRSGHGLGLLVGLSCGVAIVVFVSGAAYFRSVERSFADVV
jgi:lipopolysaccharide transport system permease protein